MHFEIIVAFVNAMLIVFSFIILQKIKKHSKILSLLNRKNIEIIDKLETLQNIYHLFDLLEIQQNLLSNQIWKLQQSCKNTKFCKIE
jgi:hypothetical protein